MVFKSWQTGRAELFEEIRERKQAKAMQGLIQLKNIFCRGSLEEKRECAGAGGTSVVVPAKEVSWDLYLWGDPRPRVPQ